MLLIKEEYSFKQFACSVVTKSEKGEIIFFCFVLFSLTPASAGLVKHVSRTATNSRNSRVKLSHI